MGKRDVVWMGEQPTSCEICSAPLGQGRGQEYQWVGITGRWHKIGG
jgi:hypothetical protein